MRGARGVVVVCVAGVACGAGAAQAQVVGLYDFAYVPSQSGLNAAIDVGAQAGGTLIGDYDAVDNPAGTRTKPGLFGSFGATENVAVNVSNLGIGLGGNLNTDTTGGFRMAFDSNAGTVALSDLSANFLGNGAASLPITVSLSTETFRTRNPTFLYPGVPIDLPIGSASVTALSMTQVGPSIGTLTQTGPNAYDFAVATLVNVSLSAGALGQVIDLPGTAALPFGFAGSVVFSGETAVVTSLVPIDFSQSQDPGQVLPEFALPLPTLDPNTPANVLLNLTLNQIGAEIAGDLRTTANGVLVPAPGSAVLGLAALLMARRRRGR
mgnify:CR=1 FL=1